MFILELQPPGQATKQHLQPPGLKLNKISEMLRNNKQEIGNIIAGDY